MPLHNHERTYPDGRIYYQTERGTTFPDTFTADEVTRHSRDNACYCRLDAGDYWRRFYCGKEINFWEAAK